MVCLTAFYCSILFLEKSKHASTTPNNWIISEQMSTLEISGLSARKKPRAVMGFFDLVVAPLEMISERATRRVLTHHRFQSVLISGDKSPQTDRWHRPLCLICTVTLLHSAWAHNETCTVFSTNECQSHLSVPYKWVTWCSYWPG